MMLPLVVVLRFGGPGPDRTEGRWSARRDEPRPRGQFAPGRLTQEFRALVGAAARSLAGDDIVNLDEILRRSSS